jgi:integrase
VEPQRRGRRDGGPGLGSRDDFGRSTRCGATTWVEPRRRSPGATINIAPSVARILQRCVEGKQADDFVFTTTARSPGSGSLRWAGGRPIHQADFHDQRWSKAVARAQAAGFSKRPTPHDLRHTHVAWLVAGQVPLPHIQQKLGHESITTTIDTYGHLLAQGHEAADAAVDAALGGRRIGVAKSTSDSVAG